MWSIPGTLVIELACNWTIHVLGPCYQMREHLCASAKVSQLEVLDTSLMMNLSRKYLNILCNESCMFVVNAKMCQ